MPLTIFTGVQMRPESFTFARIQGLTNIDRLITKINPTYPIDKQEENRDKYSCY
jgi:hypothetical protein